MDEESILTDELAKRILGNIGAVPGSKFGMVGITTREFLTNKVIETEFGREPVWAGEIKYGPAQKIKMLLTNLNTEDSPDYYLIINFQSTVIALENFDYTFLMRHDKKWVPLSILKQLNVAALIEWVTQEGLVWEPCNDFQELYPLLLSFIETTDDEGT